jgi:AraC-like DNA-binding protein
MSRLCLRAHGVRTHFVDLSGKTARPNDGLMCLSGIRRKRDCALQESVNLGEPRTFQPAPGIASWILALEHKRMIHGGLASDEVRIEDGGVYRDQTLEYLASHGMSATQAERFLAGLPLWPESKLKASAAWAQETFYQISGWQPELMPENRLRLLQQTQVNQAIEEHRKLGRTTLYAFEKERLLLASIRAGDRNEARRLLNEMLSVVYLSSPELVVLRARAVELMSCLTRAAIEDNPLLEPLIERNHAWTERLVRARNFEDLSQVLMEALDDFIDGIYLHGANRSNMKVRKALDFIGENFMKRIALRTVAHEVGLSPCRCAHLVKQHTGRTVLQIVQQVRIQHAQHLLERTSKSCTDIAYEIGFGDQSYFTKHFRRLTGTTPMRYRRSRGATVEGQA